MVKSSNPFKRQKCEKCDIKIPKAHPKLYCSECNNLKHLACQNLTKADANHIVHLNIPWTCTECISQILPVNTCSAPKRHNTINPDNFKVQCSSCNGFSYIIIILT